MATTRMDVTKLIHGKETVRDLLSQFSAGARERLETVLIEVSFDGLIESAVVRNVLRLEGGVMTIEQFMLDMLPIARLYSVPSTSGFRVGAACEGASGNVYFGANLELPGVPLVLTIHAEQSAVLNALAHRERAVQSLAVSSPPCGHCRQFLKELTTASTLRLMTSGQPPTTLASLLPDSFGPDDLGIREGLFGQSEARLIVPSVETDPLVDSALRAASRSYAPYTHSYSGIALRLKDKMMITGSRVENAAYNPSLPPILMAIDRLRFIDRQYSDISEAVLVESEGAKISQQGITRLVLQTIAPAARLRVLRASIATK